MKTFSSRIGYLFLLGMMISSLLFSACSTPASKMSLHYDTRYVSLDVPRNYFLSKEEFKDEEDYCCMYFKQDGYQEHFTIYIEKETASEFRRNLSLHVHIEEYAFGERSDATIGGLDFVSYGIPTHGLAGDYKTQMYVHRDEKSGMTITICDATLGLFFDEICTSMQFTLPDFGLSDPPYTWEHDHLLFPDTEGTLGSFKIQTHQLIFSERVFHATERDRNSSTALSACVSEEYLYTIGIQKITAYQIGNDSLDRIDYTECSMDISARLMDLPNGGTARFLQEGSYFLAEQYGDEYRNFMPAFNRTAVSPDGNLILGKGPGNTILKFNFDAKRYTFFTEDYPIEYSDENQTIWNLFITEHYIVLYCEENNEEPDVSVQDRVSVYHLYAFDLAGNYLTELSYGEDTSDDLYDVVEVDGNLIGLFNFPARLVMWDRGGNIIDAITVKELCGLENADMNPEQVCSLTPMKVSSEDGASEFLFLIGYDDGGGLLEDYAFRLTFSN